MAPGKGSRGQPIAPHPPLPEYYRRDEDRRGFVGKIFDRTAVHYDRITRLASLGSGLRYRREALERAGLRPGMTVLDVGVGTGLVARAASELLGGSGRVLGLDPSLGMLVQARRSVPGPPLPILQAFAERLPLRDGAVDFLTMGYALRHVADVRGTFRELYRVLRPGGVILILEVTRPRSALWFRGIRFYLKTVVPALAWATGSREARTLMRYFWDTIEYCIPPETILEALASAGLRSPRRRVLWGILSEYTGVKLVA